MTYKKQKHIFTDIQKPTLRTKSLLGVSKKLQLSKDSRHKRPSLQSLLSPIVILVYIFFTISVLFLPGEAKAVSYTWDGGGGVDTNWSNCTNWTTDTCPGSADTAVFDNTSDNNSTIDASFAGTITTININSGYDGTITMARSLTVSTSFTQAAGFFTASNQTLDINGTGSSAFALSGGNFTAPSTNMYLTGGFNITNSPTFNNNGGTLTFDGASAATLSCNNVVLNLVVFAHTGNNVKTVGSNCSLPLGNDPTVGADSNADLTVNGTLSGTGTISIGTSGTSSGLTINSTGVLSGFSGLVTNGNFTINSASVNAGSFTTMDVNSAFSLTTGASFTAPSSIMTVAGSFSVVSGTTFNANGGTLTFDTTTATIGCNNTVFNLVTFGSTGVTKTVGSDCNLPLGNNPTIPTAVTLAGTLSGTGTLNHTTNTLRINSTGVLSGFSGLNASIFTIDAATVNLGSYSPVDINGAFTLQNGATFTAPSGTATFASTFTLNSGTTFNANGSTVTFDGSSSSTLSCNNAVFSNVAFTQTAGTKTVSSNCNLPLGTNPTIGAGGAVSLSGILSGSGTATFQGDGSASALTLLAGSSLSGFNGLVTFGGLGVNGATADFSTYTTFDVGGTAGGFNLQSGGIFTAPSGEMKDKGSFIINSGTTFNANGGTVVFDGTIDQGPSSTSCPNFSFSKVVINKADGNFAVNNGCNIPLGTNPTASISTSKSIVSYGTLSGIGTLTTAGTLYLGVGYALSGFTGLNTNNLTVDGNTADFGSYNTLDVDGNFTLTNPTNFTSPSGIFTVGGNFNAGSDEGRLRLPDISGNYASTPDSVALSINGDMDIRANVAMQDWTPNVEKSIIGKWTLAGNQRSYLLAVPTSGKLRLYTSNDGTASISTDSTVAIGTADGSPQWLRATLDVNDGSGNRVVNFYISNDPTNTDPSSVVWTQLGTTVTTAGTTTVFDSTSELSIGGRESGTSSSRLIGSVYYTEIRNNILDNGSGIVFDANFTDHATGTTSFTESSTNAATVTINGSQALLVDTGPPTFNHNNGTVILDGGDQSVQGTTFYNLTKICASACTLTMPAGSTETILGTLTLQGAEGQLLSIVSSIPGSPWYIDAQGGRNLAYLAVSDSVSINSTAMQACNSVDAGGNSNWVFNSSACSNSGSGSDTLASTGDNTKYSYYWAIVLILVGLFGVSWVARKANN